VVVHLIQIDDHLHEVIEVVIVDDDEVEEDDEVGNINIYQ
jgi:hypothetical protein